MSGAIRSTRTTRPGATPAVLTAVVFAYGALESMLIPALPIIQKDLGASTQAIALAITGLLLVSAVATPVIGRLCDIADKRRVLIGVVGVVIVGILVSATAGSAVQLIAGQMLQGAGAGLGPLAIGLLNDTQPAHRVRPAIGLVVGASALSAALGLLVAGPIISVLPFSWLFWIPLAVLVVSLIAAWRIVPASPPVTSGSIDWRGAVLLAAGLISLLLAVTIAPGVGWTSGGVLLLIAVAVVLIALFVLAELRTAQPLIDVRGLASRTVFLTCTVSFAIGFGTFSLYVLVPNLASLPVSTGYGLGATTTAVGLLLIPFGVLAAVSSPLTSRVERLLGARGVMMLGAVLVLVSALLLLFAYGTPWVLYLSSGLFGVGVGLATAQSMNILVSVVPTERLASVTGTAFVLRSIGGTLGGQIGASVLASDLVPGTAIPAWSGFATAFVIGAAISAIAVVLTVSLPARLSTVAPAVPNRT